ncbi:phospholipase A2 inhibitor and Ly6/PLAUR domain-containing protein-like [Mauremys reevesii]|uniref:phospholipase A2 inhibitor and Ly6/PLAUR domain-containing protein-like n=1 Tax=Mauremys reevesii TaxID=260615 RepID=UPI00193F7006|nr:phospholipase A2 inhibitor and Ly6/PLAUR domain-containing protein-like [Mauremys reevesii]
MWAPLPLCLLSALLATGSALQCEVCQSKAGSCSGPLQPCGPSEGTCVAAVAEFNLEANSFSYAAKSCLEPESCEPGPFTLTFTRNITVRANIACCDTDGCNAGAIPVPPVSPVPNGRQCPSCFAAGADRCRDMEPLACTGAEDHCVDIAGTLTLGSVTLTKAAAGCGSPGACVKRVGVKKYAQGVVDVLSRGECYPAPWAGGEL